MKLDVDQKLIGNIDNNVSDDIVATIKQEHYDYNNIRSTMGNLQQTQSIMLRYFDDYKNAGLQDYKKHFIDTDLMPLYRKHVDKLLTELYKHYEFSDYMCFIAMLIPYGKVGMHIDSAPFLDECHRVHIPLKTNENVFYIIENKKYNWKKNGIYEFDNKRSHGVENNSGEERIHFMFNLYK
jgi:hypothetical protein